MSETDATAKAGGNTRADAGHKRSPAPQDATKNENIVVFARRDRAEPASEGTASTDASAPHDVAPPTEAAAAVALPPNVEIELKLLVDPDRLSDFNDAPVIAANARTRGSRKHLKSVYYDTPERTLWRNLRWASDAKAVKA